MNDKRARALARHFMETRLRGPLSDLGGCPVAACSREAFEAELVRLIQRAAAETCSPLGILREKLATIDAPLVRLHPPLGERAGRPLPPSSTVAKRTRPGARRRATIGDAC